MYKMQPTKKLTRMEKVIRIFSIIMVLVILTSIGMVLWSVIETIMS
ncbi:hypothetical protein [Dolosicoccus paucivorans]|nr:hypothetical protein [Dolosicoccus paucivorans]SDI91942.1 hypothetical protein SAMN04487994_10737 [Dolosicoccus paucivorans]